MAKPKAIPIEDAVTGCRHAGNGMVPGKSPVQSALKREASLVGLAYLNYIYQNDISNQHFCEAMLLMHAQVPQGTRNPYVALFEAERAAATMAALAEGLRRKSACRKCAHPVYWMRKNRLAPH